MSDDILDRPAGALVSRTAGETSLWMEEVGKRVRAIEGRLVLKHWTGEIEDRILSLEAKADRPLMTMDTGENRDALFEERHARLSTIATLNSTIDRREDTMAKAKDEWEKVVNRKNIRLSKAGDEIDELNDKIKQLEKTITQKTQQNAAQVATWSELKETEQRLKSQLASERDHGNEMLIVHRTLEGSPRQVDGADEYRNGYKKGWLGLRAHLLTKLNEPATVPEKGERLDPNPSYGASYHEPGFAPECGCPQVGDNTWRHEETCSKRHYVSAALGGFTVTLEMHNTPDGIVIVGSEVVKDV